MTINIKYFIDYWGDLSKDEKNQVFNIFRSDRKDVTWIKAVALNRRKVPKEVQLEITGIEEILSKEAREIIDSLDSELLVRCLHVHCGHPQPLWWNGYHHVSYKPWDSVITEVLLTFNIRCFDVAVKELVRSLILDKQRRFKNGYSIWEAICKSNTDIRKKLFNALLSDTVTINSASKIQLWDRLLSNCDNDEIKIFTIVISENIEAIQYFHHEPKQIFEIFNKKFFEKELLPALKTDYSLFRLCNNLLHLQKTTEDVLGEEFLKENSVRLNDSIFSKIEKEYDETPPSLFLTNRYVLYTADKLSYQGIERLQEIIEDCNKRISKLGYEAQNKFNDEYRIEDWIY